MVDAYTFQKNGESKTFSTRAEMLDWMVENDHVYLEGDAASIQKKHVEARLKGAKKDHPKFLAAKQKLDDNLVE